MLIIDSQRCTNCGVCIYECHTGAIQEKRGRFVICPDNCVLCEACMDICEQEAIQEMK